MAHWDITFFADCQGCSRTLSTDNFEEDGKTVGRCPKCRNKRRKTVKQKQLCEECGRKACFNFEDEEKGIRCSKHKISGMVNLHSKIQSKKRFIKRILELGGQVIGEYKRNDIPVECICSNEHKCNPRPGDIHQGRGMCRICSGLDFETSKQNFINRIQKLGGQVIGEYKGSTILVECVCSENHVCYPNPSSIQQGKGMCKICAGNDLETAKQNFINNIRELGGQVVGEYKRNDIPVECICLNEHKCNPRPGDIQQGQGMCKICAGNDLETAKQNFFNNIQKLGGQVVGEYMGRDIPIKCMCSKGHDCNPRPSGIQQGQGMCRICAGNDSETAKQNFINNIRELGGQVVGEYMGSNISVKCICPHGHDCNPRPGNIQSGQGMCRICSGLDFETSKQNFIKRIGELGGKIIGEYKGYDVNVKCICRNDHECYPTPHHIQQGLGMCAQCNQSGGEMMLYNSLKNIGVNPTYQARHYSIPTLKYDYSVLINNKIIYIEFHGIQHEEFNTFFHKDIDMFLHRRQLDLLKIYIAKKHNIKLIIFDHMWSKKSIKEWTEYLQKVLYDDRQLIADSVLHDWIRNESPSEDYISKYIKE